MQKARAVFLAALVVLAVATAGGTAAGAGLTGVDHPSANSPSTTDASDACEFPVTVTDATGTEVTLDEQPDRITTTNPSAAQTLWELGAKDRVVGVTQFATYLDGAEDRTNVSSDGFGVSVERVVATAPDLVLAPNASAGQVDALRDAGLTVYHFPEATDIDDIAEKTERTGRLVGNCDSAADVNTEMNDTVADVKDRTADFDRPDALYPLGGGFVAADETFINEIMEIGGTTNVAAAEGDGYPQLSDEVILETDPELLIVTSPDAAILDEQPYASTTAGAEESYVVMDRNYLNQPAPRSVIESAETLAAGVEEFQAENTCEFPVTVTDATGTEITLDERPDRITTTNPSAAQTLWELGAKDRVVGVTQFATYLDGAEDRTNVSANFGVNVERVVDTDPDLVLAPNASAGQVEDLRDAGLTVYHFPEATDVDDIAAKTERTGRLVGSCEAAGEVNTEMNETVADVEDRTADLDRPEALYPLGGGFVAADETFINEIMRIGGTTNVAAAEGDGYPQLSDEVILETNPELLIVTSPDAAILDEQPYASTTAGIERNYVVMDVNYLNQPAPRSVIESTETLATEVEELQPDDQASSSGGGGGGGGSTAEEPTEENVSTENVSEPNATGENVSEPNATDENQTVTNATDENTTTADEETDTTSESTDETDQETASTDSSGSTDDSESTDTDDPSAESTNTTAEETQTDTPGFGVVVALVALLAGALVARHR
jgi:putative ABC transporter PGF-CTERM-modified substrate-binding protein